MYRCYTQVCSNVCLLCHKFAIWMKWNTNHISLHSIYRLNKKSIWLSYGQIITDTTIFHIKRLKIFVLPVPTVELRIIFSTKNKTNPGQLTERGSINVQNFKIVCWMSQVYYIIKYTKLLYIVQMYNEWYTILSSLVNFFYQYWTSL